MDVIQIVLQVICGAGIACNFLTVAIFAVTRQLRKKYYGFIFNLVLADIIFPTAALLNQFRPSSLFVSLTWTSFFAAELSILAIAVNRHLAVCTTPPARYDALVTRFRVTVVCALIWAVSAIVYFPMTYAGTALASNFIGPLLILVLILFSGFVYYLVYRKITSVSGVSDCDEQTCTQLDRSRHLMVTFSVILVVSFVCWVPFCTGNFTIYFRGKGFEALGRSFGMYYWSTFTYLMVYAIINPIICWWRIAEFRAGLYGLVSLRSCRQSAPTGCQPVNVEIVVQPAV